MIRQITRSFFMHPIEPNIQWFQGLRTMKISLRSVVESEERSSLTRLIFKASTRYSLPLFSILFSPRSTFIRVYEEEEEHRRIPHCWIRRSIVSLDWSSRLRQGDEHLHGLSRSSTTSLQWVSVNSAEINGGKEETISSYLIGLQGIADILGSFIANTVPWKTQWYKCLGTTGLRTSYSIERKNHGRTWLTLNALARY